MQTDVAVLGKQSAGILVVDDERTLRFTLKEGLSEEGYRVETAADGAEALERLKHDEFHLVLLDQKLPDISGLDLLRDLRAKYPDLQIVMMTAYGQISQAVQATKAGCYDYLSKPFELDHVKLVIQNALSQTRLTDEVVRLRDVDRRRAGSRLIVGPQSRMHRIVETIAKVAQSGSSTVLLLGETGVGKELLAREIHDRSPRRDAPFVEVNCSAFSDTLLESELFGHEKGAFTDAKRAKKGLMELAHGGTLFLDEIGEMSSSLQSKLLRAFELKRFRKVGGEVDLHVDARIVAATNRDLNEMVAQGTFREDLYFRLNVIRVEVPPLRERPEDIPALIDHFIAHFNRELSRDVKGPTQEALELLTAYGWRGNVRELKNVIERCILLESETEILAEHLPLEIVGAGGSGAKVIQTRIHAEGSIPTLAEVERMAIQHALEQTGGNKTRAAEKLNISRQTLRTKLKEYRIDPPGGHGS
jgi:two-component system, NtrC family, response regulator AtoC